MAHGAVVVFHSASSVQLFISRQTGTFHQVWFDPWLKQVLASCGLTLPQRNLCTKKTPLLGLKS